MSQPIEIVIEPANGGGFIVEVETPREKPAEGYKPHEVGRNVTTKHAFTTAAEVGAFVAKRLGGEGETFTPAHDPAQWFKSPIAGLGGTLSGKRLDQRDFLRHPDTPPDKRLCLVPIEPTDPMVDAGRAAESLMPPECSVVRVYRAMLEAWNEEQDR